MKTTITLNLYHNGLIDKDEAVRILTKEIEAANEESYKVIDNMIDFSLKHKTVVQMVKEQYRGLGKTTKLAKRADELGAVLVVTDGRVARELGDMGFYNTVFFSNANRVIGHRYPKGFIVDEGVHPEIIRALSRDNELLGGFSRI